MNEMKLIKISPSSVILNVGEWYHGAIVELYPNTLKPTNLVWSSNKQSVASVNPINGYIYAHNPGVAIITARLDTEETVNACYTVFVESHDQLNTDVTFSNETKTNYNNARLVTRSDCGSYSDAAIGYSGTIYSYTICGNNVTLNKGGFSKTKSYNKYAALFQAAVYDMAVIYDSFSPLQRKAWLILRVYGFLTSFSIDTLDAILLLSGVDLQEQLASTILGMNAWYRAEEQAQNYFSLF